MEVEIYKLFDFAEKSGYNMNDILGISRKKSIVLPRCIIWKLLKDEGISYKGISLRMNRNYATIIHGINRVNQLLYVGNKETKMIFNTLKQWKS